jgi:glyoxylase-like metal-dependent hydrolase (beta-lactamase superfamily II)
VTIESKTYAIGDATVTQVRELALENSSPAALFPAWDPKILVDCQDWLSPGSMDPAHEHAFMSVHTWVVKTKRHTIVIDTGVGNGKNRPFTPGFDHLDLPFLERLRAAGVAPEAVDYVLMTHLHVDHAGWNTRPEGGAWIPTFPNARYIFSKKEYEYFTDPANHNDRNKTSFLVQQDSVRPVVEAGLADMIAIDGREIVDGLSFVPSPGHSVDHASIVLASGGQQALFTGDLLHHPIQVHRPGWNSVFDGFPDQARASRLWALDFAADTGATVFCAHFPETSAGCVTREGGIFKWRFKE